MAKDKDGVINNDAIEQNIDYRKEEKKLEKARVKQEESDKATDAEVSNRTSRYDQDLKERARTYGINPDNFATEEDLGATVKKYEDDNGILGTPNEKDQQ